MIVPARHVIHYIYYWTTIKHLREQKTNSARNLIVNQNNMKIIFCTIYLLIATFEPMINLVSLNSLMVHGHYSNDFQIPGCISLSKIFCCRGIFIPKLCQVFDFLRFLKFFVFSSESLFPYSILPGIICRKQKFDEESCENMCDKTRLTKPCFSCSLNVRKVHFAFQ